jgi:hypothetical protein
LVCSFMVLPTPAISIRRTIRKTRRNPSKRKSWEDHDVKEHHYTKRTLARFC